MNVLILEDEQRNFNRLRRQLEEIDTTFHVEGPLANIQESVEWLRTHPTPDLILADIRLSDGLSFDVLRQTAISILLVRLSLQLPMMNMQSKLLNITASTTCSNPLIPKNWLKPSIRCVAGLCPTRMEKICVG